MTFALIMLAIPAIAFAQTAPTIQSDKADYAPGATVTLTGSGWQAGESVNINVNDDEGQTWNRNVDVTADANGQIRDQFQLPNTFVAVYKVTATGAQSGVTTTSFTDGNVTFIGTNTPSNAPTSWTVNWTQHKNNTNCSSTGTAGTTTISGTGSGNAGGINAGDTLKLGTVTDTSPTVVFDYWSTDAAGNNPYTNTCITGKNGNVIDLYAHFKAANTAPVANAQSVTTNEDTAKAITLTATDADNNTLTYTIVSGPAHGSLSGSGANQTYTPNADYNGADSFTFKANDGTVDSNTATVSITVTAVNDNPVAVNDAKTTAEDNATDINVIANDTDVDNINAQLSVSSFTQPSHGQVTQNADGTLKYTPAADYSGSDSFTYKAKDADNAESNSATVTITVSPVNDAPVAVDDAKTTDEDNATDIAVLANDTDVDNTNAQLSVSNFTQPLHGTVTDNNDGTLKYTPNDNYNGPDSFDYTVSDGNGGTDQGTVSITVTAVNDAPVADDQSVTTDEDTPKGVTLSASDVDEGDALTYEVVTAPQHGTLSGTGANRTYTPDANYFGSDSFTFKANDGTDNSNTATVSITVNAVNDAPVATNDSYSTNEDITLNIPAPGVLSNDTDVENEQLSAVKVSDPAHGQLTLNADGSFTYAPQANYNGADSFTYKANDGTANSNVATVNITVNAVNDAPTVTLSGDALADEGQTKTYTFAVNDPDSGDTFTIKSGFPDCGTGGDYIASSLTTTASGGSFKCTFPDGAGPANPTVTTVKIQVTDGQHADSNIATKSVTVANVKPTIGPLTVSGSGTACIGSNNVVKLSFSITDPGVEDTHSGTINWGDGTTTQFYGSSVTDAQHSYSAGTYTITVNASDNDGGTDSRSTAGTNQQVSLLYNVSYLLDPVNVPSATTPMSVFKSGSVIPLRVIITDCNNQPVNGLVPRISFTNVSKATPTIAPNEAVSIQPNDTNYLMRDAGNGQYIYNLSTKSLPDPDATYNATITDSKATQTAPATYGPKVSQNFGVRSK